MAAFPSYARLLLDGYGERHESVVQRTEVDRGPPKQRRFQSNALVQVPVKALFRSANDAAAFEDWFYTDADAGASPFDWLDVRTKTVRQGRIVAGSLGPLTPESTGMWLFSRQLTIEYYWDSTYQNGTLILDFIANTYKVKAPPLASTTFSNLITFTRSTTAWCYDSSGGLVQVAANQPRFDYDPVTRAARGLLIEESRKNTLKNSRNLTASGWATGATLGNFYTVTANSTDILAPDGTSANVTKFVAAGLASGLFARQAGLTADIVAGSRTASLFVYVPVQAGVNNFSIYADWSDTETGTEDVSTTFGRWVRLSSVATLAAVRDAIDFNIRVNGTTPPAGFLFYTHWGQEEPGMFMTSPIATTSTAATRSADIAAINRTLPWLNEIEGTLFVEAVIGGGLTTRTLWQLDNGSTANRHLVRITSGGPFQVSTFSASTAVTNLAGPTAIAGAPHKIAYGYKANDFAASYNGGIATDNNGAVPNGLTTLRIGSTISGEYWSGYIKRIAYYDRRLSNADLQALTK